ncbi:SIMPL domain-containing protein [Roseisalinus antarcticus]|uniref:26 kDa periplasmic immunogenic protein n=1 Tax=Roseisalinus antarcticus TaxID=254357 RepID=A0A1Y5SGY3_9RHOB|nr:SIMPL domain-containing protein [Roseisalinus antarcticus]SLN40594.1 26 kDa periplasmic immunogenic protein precursor [Roseisalinus antarcticus]
MTRIGFQIINLVLAAVAAAAFLALFGLAARPAAAQGFEAPVIRVSGEGAVTVAPDMAVLSLGIREEARTAEVAVAAMGRRTQSVLDALAEVGIVKTDIATGSLRLDPTFSSSSINSGPQVTGFVSEITLEVRIRDLDELGGILSSVVAEGSNLFQGVQFDVADRDEALDEARALAVADARARAEVFAAAAGVALGPLLSLSEASAGGGPAPMMESRAMDFVPVPQGELTIRANVTMVYGISE